MIEDELILIDDFLTNNEIELIKKELIDNKMLIVRDPEIINNTSYFRWFLDSHFKNARYFSPTLSSMDRNLFSEETKNTVKQKESLAFKKYEYTNFHETQLTVYTNGGRYTWHRDENAGRLISFVLPIDLTKREYTGGELILKHKDEEVKIIPKHNQLILFSGQLLHKVEEVKVNSDDMFKGRVVINGHIGFRT